MVVWLFLLFLSLVGSTLLGKHGKRASSSVLFSKDDPAPQAPKVDASNAAASVSSLPPLNLIIVRHAFSCSNIDKYYKQENKLPTGTKLSEEFKQDPPLTYFGIESSDKGKGPLAAYINAEFGAQPYKILASTLIRAEETAYYQLAGPTGKGISIVPHMAETSSIPAAGGIKSSDKPPRLRPDQRSIIAARNHAVVAALRAGRDSRDADCASPDANALCDASDFVNDGTLEISDVPKFLAWISAPGRVARWAEAGSDGVHRAVLFTHSNLMSQEFGAPKEAVSNNCAMNVTLRASSDGGGEGGGGGIYSINLKERPVVVNSFGLPRMDFSSERPAASAMCSHDSGCPGRFICESAAITDPWTSSTLHDKCAYGWGGEGKTQTREAAPVAAPASAFLQLSEGERQKGGAHQAASAHTSDVYNICG